MFIYGTYVRTLLILQLPCSQDKMYLREDSFQCLHLCETNLSQNILQKKTAIFIPTFRGWHTLLYTEGKEIPPGHLQSLRLS